MIEPLGLDWLPERQDWSVALEEARVAPLREALPTYQALANCRLDFARTAKLDKALQRHMAAELTSPPALPSVRLGLLGSSTLAHLVPGIRIAGLRRGLLVQIHEGDYGMYRQELSDRSSRLHDFAPQAVLLAFDAQHMSAAAGASAGAAIATMRTCWDLARDAFGCAVIQQTLLPIFPPVLGNNEQRSPHSPLAIVQQVNAELRRLAETEDVHLLGLDWFASQDGLAAWYEPSLWNRSKQEVHPRVSHVYGDQVGRILGALRGRSSKCLVLDLDNTLWGGVIGDDGLEGIILGQGSGVGEAFVGFQKYAKSLTKRGVILAVCSKNDEANALLPFDSHPEMILKRSDISCFVANWSDKAENLRHIAATLNIGLDSLVFADDNPAERGLIRRELPMVAVPELPEDPSDYLGCLARAGYFEGLTVTAEDRDRSALYQANAERDRLRESVTDMGSYLAALQMKLYWAPFDDLGLARIVQLINKTNQFNLTTRRYTDGEVRAIMRDPNALTLQLRLKDCYGDNGIISLLIGCQQGDHLHMDTWLMSCRVLGRQVEEATMNLLAEQALRRGVSYLSGKYVPSAKNGMVRDHYRKLGFAEALPSSKDTKDTTSWTMDLTRYAPTATKITVIEGMDASN